MATILGIQLKAPTPMGAGLALGIGLAASALLMGAGELVGAPVRGAQVAAFGVACAWGGLAAAMGASIVGAPAPWRPLMITGVPAVAMAFIVSALA